MKQDLVEATVHTELKFSGDFELEEKISMLVEVLMLIRSFSFQCLLVNEGDVRRY